MWAFFDFSMVLAMISNMLSVLEQIWNFFFGTETEYE